MSTRTLEIARVDPEHPPIGEDHILFAPALPPPIPITGPRFARRSLLVAPADRAVTEPVRQWLQAFVESRHKTATGSANHPTIEMVLDAEASISAILTEDDIRPSRKERGIRCPRTTREQLVIRQESDATRHRVEHVFRDIHLAAGKHVDGIEIVSPHVRLESGSGRTPLMPGEHVLLTAEMYARVAIAQYDEIIFLVGEHGHRTWVRNWKRGSKSWVVIFR